MATGTPVQTASRTFSITVTPSSSTAQPGEIVRHTLAVQPKDGFSAPIEVRVSATALGGIYREERDLGTVAAPYPPALHPHHDRGPRDHGERGRHRPDRAGAAGHQEIERRHGISADMAVSQLLHRRIEETLREYPKIAPESYKFAQNRGRF